MWERIAMLEALKLWSRLRAIGLEPSRAILRPRPWPVFAADEAAEAGSVENIEEERVVDLTRILPGGNARDLNMSG
jgi:hypothetical protein